MCMTPFIVQQEGIGSVPVPCGKCPLCVARRVSSWSFRLRQEEKNSSSAHFLTLTYSIKEVPITSRGYMTIDKEHVQNFIKRLRYYNAKESNEKIKYYCVGEYGGKTNRPHYHAIVFNCRIQNIQPAWDMGHVHYGNVSGASIGYTLKYMAKKGKIPMHANDDRVPEFALMSKGLGKNYLTEDMIRWHKEDIANRMYVNIEDGKK